MPRSLPPEIDHLADTIERAHATLAATRARAERTRLANAEAKATVARSKELLRTLEGLHKQFPYLSGDAPPLTPPAELDID